jgi:hypothetical protein
VLIVIGAVLVLLALVVVGPMLVMFTGALWSALMGWSLSEDAYLRANATSADSDGEAE